MVDDPMVVLRQQMVRIIAAHMALADEYVGADTLQERVLQAMALVPRHEFVPTELKPFAYADQPLPIGFDKTISQPFIVALMTDMLDIGEGDVVLEVGTGLGYHAAILAQLARRVYSVEIIEELAEQARDRLSRMAYDNVEMRTGNGFQGWPEHGPFDRILVCAGSDLIPSPLIAQLRPGGRMVCPTGLPESQRLTLVVKDSSGRTRITEGMPVRFALLETGD